MIDALLITACIKPTINNFISIKDEQARLNSYLDALDFWITQSEFKYLVFCENSNFEYDYTPLKKKALKHGKELEVILFIGNEKVMDFGKGFAEGEIIEHALSKSELLRQTDSFYKVTGRIKIANINKILSIHSDDENYFNLAAPGAKSVDTRFFKVNIDFYKEKLLKKYEEVRDEEGIYLEVVFYNHLSRLSPSSFKRYPIAKGISASTGTTYEKSSFGIFLRNILSILGRYRVS